MASEPALALVDSDETRLMREAVRGICEGFGPAYIKGWVEAGEPLPENWDEIPGARGCTPQSCAFRDHHAEIAALGAHVVGLSAQTTPVQLEAVERLGLPYPLASDPLLTVADALGLPTFEAGGERLYERLTFIARAGVIEKVFHPVVPPDRNAQEVVEWLTQRR